MLGSTAFATRKVPTRFTSICAENSCDVKASIGPPNPTPALLIRTSTSGILATAASTLSSEVTSNSRTSSFKPSDFPKSLNAVAAFSFLPFVPRIVA